MKSSTIVNVSILVTCITILAILPGWFSMLVFRTSLNSPIYYGVIIVLSVASIVFGMLQCIPSYDKKEQEQPKATKSRIPTFKTSEEEAAFWDTHSSEEFAEELTPVENVRFVKARSKKALLVQAEEFSREAREG